MLNPEIAACIHAVDTIVKPMEETELGHFAGAIGVALAKYRQPTEGDVDDAFTRLKKQLSSS
jgi:hypothetical protein